jgi:hypothetical protein
MNGMFIKYILNLMILCYGKGQMTMRTKIHIIIGIYVCMKSWTWMLLMIDIFLVVHSITLLKEGGFLKQSS